MNTSEFARICRTERRTIHYYDSIGLLKPDHVQENETDILRMQMDAAREDNYGSSIAGIQMESPLMKEVEDLMIKGYSGGLTNPRDFVAEGIALLNSYELQETE